MARMKIEFELLWEKRIFLAMVLVSMGHGHKLQRPGYVFCVYYTFIYFFVDFFRILLFAKEKIYYAAVGVTFNEKKLRPSQQCHLIFLWDRYVYIFKMRTRQFIIIERMSNDNRWAFQ